MVGAVVVDDDGVVVGRGSHERPAGRTPRCSRSHDAGARARGATLYCTLEPCCHTGRTGPVRAASWRRRHPPRRRRDRGSESARARPRLGATCASAASTSTVGVGGSAAARQNAAVLHATCAQRRPFVILKAALSLDGRRRRGAGTPHALTGRPPTGASTAQRAEVDAIGVGSGTILADDPAADAARRLSRPAADARRLRSPAAHAADARVLSTLDAGPVIIVTTRAARCDAAAGRAERSAGAGARRRSAAQADDLAAALRALARRGIASLVLEGGADAARAALDEGVVDERAALHHARGCSAPRRSGVDRRGPARLGSAARPPRRAGSATTC